MLTHLKRGVSLVLLSLAGELLTLFKISFIVGSWTACFSATHAYTPLVGEHGGVKASLIYYFLRTLYKIGVTGSLSSLMVVYHIPSFFGSLYSAWTKPSQSSWLLRSFLSLICGLCMLSFGFHPVGYQALPYTLLWIWPLIMPFIRTNNFFLQALASTLAVHAVGSVLWLYTYTLTPQVWLALIPVACIERLLFALGAVGFNMLYKYSRNYLSKALEGRLSGNLAYCLSLLTSCCS